MSIKDGLLAKNVKGHKVILDNGYVFDRRIFFVTSLLIIFASILLVLSLGASTEYVYLHCPIDTIGGKCWNPLYQQCSEWYCQQESLPAGFVYGEQAPWLAQQWWLVVVLIVFLGFLVNHVLHNRGFTGDDE